MKKILGLIFLLLVFKTNAQEYFSVIAENGLSIRDKPSLKGEVIGKVEAGKDVVIITKSGQEVTITYNNQLINGEWYEIESTKENPRGYVFSGYLLEQPNDDSDCDEEIPCYSNITFEKFDLEIYNYQIEENIIKKKDTIEAFEHVFNEIGNKLLHIVPKNKKDKVSVLYTIVEGISEQYDFQKIKPEDYDNWYENRVHWQGQEPFVALNNNFNFFRIPEIEYDEKEALRKEKFNLKDTLIDLSVDTYNVATLIYKEKACNYWLSPLIIKIELESENGKKSVAFLEIHLSDGD